MIIFLNKLDLSDQKNHNKGIAGNKIIKESSYFLLNTSCQSENIVIQCILCQPDPLKTRLMESVFHNFNFLTFMTQLILHIKIWLSFVMNYIICGG